MIKARGRRAGNPLREVSKFTWPHSGMGVELRFSLVDAFAENATD